MPGDHNMLSDPQLGSLALRGLRVLEIGTGPGLAYAGKLFADFGAEVIKVEALTGDSWRKIPPLIKPTAQAEPESALFAWMNTNKSSVIADDLNQEALLWLGNLARTCDVVLDARALTQGVDVLARPIWTEGESTDSHHIPIAVDLTWFGESGPYRDFVGTEAVCRAMSGAVHGSGPVLGPPHMPHDVQAGIAIGLATFSVALAAWFGRSDGSRRYVLSIHETIFSVVEMEAGMVQDKRHTPRLGVNRFGSTHPASIYATRDGWIGIFTNTLAQWVGLCQAIGRPELGSDSRFSNGPDRMKHADLIDEILVTAFLDRSTQEWFELLTEQKHPAVIVPTMAQLLNQSVHRERKAFVPVHLGSVQFEAPVLPQRLNEAGPLLGGRAPLLGADTERYLSHHLHKLTGIQTEIAASEKRPLEGLKVLDLSMGWAGPFAARKLADLGAEVIKIESPTYPDWWRGTNYTEQFYQEKLYEKNSNFNLMNRNKFGIAVDLTKPEGKHIFLELVKSADAVIENYSAEVLPKLGLTYDVLSLVNPRLLMLSMPAFGLGNAWSNTRAYGGTLEQASGLPLYTGHPDGPPAMTSYAYGDPNGGLNATAAMMLGFLLQRKTGNGRHINMSQVEGMLTLTAPFMIEQSALGTDPQRKGNRHAMHAPHGCYPCQVHDTWVVISITNDIQWASLCKLIGREDWLIDPVFATAPARLLKHNQIDAAMTSWTSQFSVDEIVSVLQRSGIAAGPVQTLTQVLEDKHLHARDFWQALSREHVGHYISSSTYFRINGKSMPIDRPAPTLGQHTNMLLKKLLSLSVSELHALESYGVIGTVARPKK